MAHPSQEAPQSADLKLEWNLFAGACSSLECMLQGAGTARAGLVGLEGFREVCVLQVDSLQMHGTGTALGDPIEVNAALAVLLAQGVGEQPLSLTAHKSSTGHAEPAAGLVSLACAAMALEALSVPGLLHLRSALPPSWIAG